MASKETSELLNLVLGLQIFAGKEVAHEFVNFEGRQGLGGF
jgi:hypothetical protein